MKRLKKQLLFFLFTFGCSCFPARTAEGCGFSERSFLGYSFLLPEVFSLPQAIAPLFLSFEKNWAQKFPTDTNNTRRENLLEWQGRFCSEPTLDDIENLVYRTPLEDLERLQTITESKRLGLDGRLAGNTFAQILRENKCFETIEYLIFSKKCEPFVTIPADPWKNPTRDPKLMQMLIDEGKKPFVRLQSHFIRLRYAYQLIRLAHYKKDYKQVVSLCDYLLPKVDKRVNSVVHHWILGHKAAALRQLGQRAEAAYYYVLVFQDSETKRESAFRSFDIRTDEEWQKCLSFCKNDREKTTMYALRASSDDSHAAEDIEKIYEINPKCDYLLPLLVAEIRKMEKVFLGNSFSNHRSPTRPQSGSYLIDLQKLTQKIAGENKALRPDLWQLANGYLEFLAGDYYAAQLTFSKLRSQVSDEKIDQQIALCALAARIANYQAADAATEEELYEIRFKNDVFSANEPRFIDYFCDKVASLYTQVGARGKAFRSKYSFQDLQKNPKIEVIDDLLGLCGKEPKTKLEKIFTSDQNAEDISYELLDLKATELLLDLRLEASLEVFRQIPPTYRAKRLYNPFYASVRECVHCPLPSDAQLYDKAEIVEKLLHLEARAKSATPVEAAENYYLLGVAFYNMTYFGNAFGATDFFRSGASWRQMGQQHIVFSNPSAAVGNRENLDCSAALTYLQKAISSSRGNHELAAKATFLAAKCQQKMYFSSKENTYHVGSNNIPKLPESYSTYFSSLKKQYADTDTYQQAIAECKYFRAFARK